MPEYYSDMSDRHLIDDRPLEELQEEARQEVNAKIDDILADRRAANLDAEVEVAAPPAHPSPEVEVESGEVEGGQVEVEGSAPRPHPAKFTPSIISALEDVLDRYVPPGSKILDPFAGVGGIHVFRPEYETWGVEIEKEWADQHFFTLHGNSLNLAPLAEMGPWDAVVTSPAYGNRMADRYAGDGTRRHTYRIDLGRELHEDNGGKHQWGSREYDELHAAVWGECYGLIREGGYMIVNVSNHVRDYQEMPVVDWHVMCLADIGFMIREMIPIRTPRMGHGANRSLRVDHEVVIVYQKPHSPSYWRAAGER